MASFVIEDVRIFDGQHAIENGSVLVEDGSIKTVSTSPIPFTGPTFSKPGQTLLPGFIDTHIHADSGNPPRFPNPSALASPPSATCTTSTPESGRDYVKQRVAEGVDYITLMHESGASYGQNFDKPSLELRRVVIEEVHEHGLSSLAHSTCLADTLEILSCGVEGLAHTLVDQPPTQELIDAYKKNGALCNPTLACQGSCTTEGKAMQERLAHDPRVQHLLGEQVPTQQAQQ
ncbi:hypothetical protein LTR08_004842 [Meristemomyces frigidus]|nr:hypothetical protein LTR08_004842 [Meristemomyces frigidus]